MRPAQRVRPAQNGDAGATGCDRRDPAREAPPSPSQGSSRITAAQGTDLSGNGHNVTTSTAVTLVADRFGNPSLAGSYNGSTSYEEVIANPLLPVGTAPRTVSVWMQTTTTYNGAAGGIWNWGSSAAPGGKRFGMIVSGSHDYFVGEDEDLAGTHVVNDGTWHNIVVAYDGTTVTTWVDAFYSVSRSAPLSTTGTSLEIGRSSRSIIRTPEPFNGSIDDLLVYNRVLSEDERARPTLPRGGWH